MREKQPIKVIIDTNLWISFLMGLQSANFQEFIVKKLLNIICFWVEITSEVAICRDSKDDYLLALAKDSQADFLITGDADLLSLGNFEGTEILTDQDFLDRI